jgi:hypothetical protein
MSLQGTKAFNDCGDGKCYRRIRTIGGQEGWVLNSGISYLPSSTCSSFSSCAGMVCDSPPANRCYSKLGTCDKGSCSYTPLTGTSCVGGVCVKGACTGAPASQGSA